MGQSGAKWYMQKGMRMPVLPDNVVPGKPRREVAQEFYTNVLELGKLARERYLDECKCGARAFDQTEIDELDANMATVEAALAQYK